MGARLQSRARRLSFLAVMIWLWAVTLAQAHVRTASIAQIRLSEISLPPVRLEWGNPCWQGRSFEAQAHLSLELPIGIFTGGDPVNYFDPDGRCVEAGANWAGSAVSGVGHLAYNTAGALEYALTSPFAPNWAYRTYGQAAGDFGNTVVGVAHTTYDVAAMSEYGLVSPFAPNFAYNNYGGSMQRLLGQEAPAFYGGNNKSLPYQITYGTLNAATLFMGGEFGEAGNVGRMGEVSSVVARTARTATVASRVWDLAPFARGQQIERMLGGNLPGNFPVIDRFANGVATSIKSIDLNAATYQNAATLTSKLNGYVNSVAGFNGETWANVEISASQITARQLQLAIPSGGISAAQQAAINAAVLRARSMGVNFIVTPIP